MAKKVGLSLGLFFCLGVFALFRGLFGLVSAVCFFGFGFLACSLAFFLKVLCVFFPA